MKGDTGWGVTFCNYGFGIVVLRFVCYNIDDRKMGYCSIVAFKVY